MRKGQILNVTVSAIVVLGLLLSACSEKPVQFNGSSVTTEKVQADANRESSRTFSIGKGRVPFTIDYAVGSPTEPDLVDPELNATVQTGDVFNVTVSVSSARRQGRLSIQAETESGLILLDAANEASFDLSKLAVSNAKTVVTVKLAVEALAAGRHYITLHTRLEGADKPYYRVSSLPVTVSGGASAQQSALKNKNAKLTTDARGRQIIRLKAD